MDYGFIPGNAANLTTGNGCGASVLVVALVVNGVKTMAKHFLMDHTGHSTVEFDKLDPVELKAANDRFEALIKNGSIAATREAGATEYEVIKRSSQQQDETLFVPQMRGG